MLRARLFTTPWSLAALSLSILFAGCRTASEEIAAQRRALTARWADLARQPARTTLAVDWPEAVRRLEHGNFKLRKARDGVLAATEAVRQLPRRYIPELTLNTFANPSFENLGNGDLGATYLFLGSLFDLPNPLRYHAVALQTQLRCLSVRLDAEILRRDLHAKLYQLFRQGARLNTADRQLAALRELNGTAANHPFDAQISGLAATQREGWQKLEAGLGDLFGDYTHRWHPAANARLPDIDYAAHPPALDGRDGFGALQITQAALQLVVLEAQRQGLLAAEWPQVSVLLSAPPIYQRSSGRESYLSADDLRLSAFAAYATDFRGNRALARKQAARRARITRQELDAAMQSTVGRLRDALRLAATLHDQLQQLQNARRELEPTGALAATTAWDDRIALLQDQLDALNLSFWVLDDPRWKTQP
jgi:hypothetical protein